VVDWGALADHYSARFVLALIGWHDGAQASRAERRSRAVCLTAKTRMLYARRRIAELMKAHGSVNPPIAGYGESLA